MTCLILYPYIEPEISTTKATIFGIGGRLGGAKKCAKYLKTIIYVDIVLV